MKITFLGTGSIIPNPKTNDESFRSYASLLVEVENETLLFDIGPGTLTKMQQLGIDARIHPDHLFITHYHIDHCQDYVGLATSRCFDIKTAGLGNGKLLKVYGPPHLKAMSIDLFEKTERWKFMNNDLHVFEYLNLKEVATGLVAETSQWKVTCLPVRHYDGIAFRLDAGGKSFVYSGDMTYDENLSKLGDHADLVVVECSFPDRSMLKGLHLCPEDIVKLATLGKFKNVMLTHLYPQCEGREEEMIQYIEENSPAKVRVAHDFFRIDL